MTVSTLTELKGKDLRDAVEAMPKMYGVRVATPEDTLVYCNPDKQVLKDTMSILTSLSFGMDDIDPNDALVMLETRNVEIATLDNPDYCNVYRVLNDGTTEYHVVVLDGEPFQITEWIADWNILTLPE